MTRVTYLPEKYYMKIEGHAQAVEKGMIDPVCAGVSALSFTLLLAADSTPEYHVSLYANQQDGVLEIHCDPEEEYADLCRYLFDVFYDGLQLIESDFADYLTTGGAENGK